MTTKLKCLAILGSTGSIGQQALDVVRAFPERFRVIGLAAGDNTKLLLEQAREFQPKLIYHEGKTRLLPNANCHFLPMEQMVIDEDVNLVLVATSGRAGILPTIAALRAGKTVALANKEALVMAGEIIITEARNSHAQILPVDSEHSAIWQCLDGQTSDVQNLILTASGGPFYNYSKGQLSRVTPEQALKHPSWKMGKKVTIDSATLMNKGLEVIEAHWLFNLPFDRIKVMVHPQSVVHSMVEFVDGSVKAQMSVPDMRLPIQYALTYPERWPNAGLPRLDWSKVGELTFAPPDLTAFPSLNIAIDAGRKGGTYPAVLCGADEVAVESFLQEQIRFTDIPAVVERTLAKHKVINNPTLDEILAADDWARAQAARLVKEMKC